MEARKVIIPLLIVCLGILCMIWLISYAKYDGYVSKETEEKYLRNLDKYEMIDYDQTYISLTYSDTLSYMAHTAFHSVTPFQKWYIAEVGMIRTNSELHRRLNEMSRKYVSTPNPLK